MDKNPSGIANDCNTAVASNTDRKENRPVNTNMP